MPSLDPSLLSHGGPLIWVLLALGLILIVLFVERALYLHRGQIRSTAFIHGIKNILAKRRLIEALTVCEETPGPVAAVVKAALLHAEDDADSMRFHVQEAALVELPSLERRIGAIAAIAQVAPLVGLLGTVLGMIVTFASFQRDYATSSALATGMWQALLCAAGGLMLAIPAHLAHHFLTARVRAIVRDVEWSGNEIMKYLLTEYRTSVPKWIARPLDLYSRLRPAPRNFDAIFYVNVGLVGVFFLLFGSRFVLAPGLGVDFRLPQVAGAISGASATTCYVSVLRSGQIFTEDGLLTLPETREWLKVHAKRDRQPSLLIRASAGATLAELAEIQGAAHEAGFQKVVWAAEEPAALSR